MMKLQIKSAILLIVSCFCISFQTTITITNSTALWHNGQVPYVIDSNVTAAQHCLIHSAMYHIAWRSCVRFHEKSINDSNYLQIQLTNHHMNESCVPLGMVANESNNVKSTILLSPACFKMDTIVYLLMRSLGINGQNNVQNSTGKLTKQATEEVNKLYNCTNPVKIEMDFIKKFSNHFAECGPKEVKYNLSIYLLTYNVNKQSPSENLTELFDFEALGKHDIYVVALQELTFSSMFTWDPYASQLDEIFRTRGYTRLARHRYMLSSLAVFVRAETVGHFVDVRKQIFTIIGYSLTKGAIAIRFFYQGLSFAFIGAHLSPYELNYYQRLKDYRDIIRAMTFSTVGVLDHDYVFFMGDLSFHISTLNAEQLSVEMIKAQSDATSSWNKLLKYDQLNIAKSETKAFAEFEEARITFAPTSEFIPGTDSYKEGKPAYTDRILYRSTLVNQINKTKMNHHESLVKLRITHYDSLDKFQGSSHKPVRAVASVPEPSFEFKRKLIKEGKLKSPLSVPLYPLTVISGF